MNDNQEDFAAAFAEAISADNKPAAEAVTPPVDAPASVEPAAEAVTPPVDAPASVEPAPKPAAKIAPRAAPVVEPTPDPVIIPDPKLSEDQEKVLADFKKEWPDIAKAQEMQIQHVTAQLEAKFARAMTTLVEKMYSDMAPMAATYAETAQSSFRDSVVSKHADFDAVAPNLKPWIEQQPAYLRKAYEAAYDDGTAEEVIDLVQRYKDANGVKPQMLDPTPSKPVVNSKKVESLAPVGGKRSVIASKGSDPNDYKSAFAEAVDSL